jgi:tRNA A-37 threonylcarbamoyl transferase component Bud32
MDWIPKPGEVLAGRYRVEGLIGTGGMAAVVSAVQLDLDRRVAIKLMPPRGAQSPITVERFMREARAASAIHSDHVVKVYEVGRLDSGAPFLVMEFLVGVPLAKLIQRRGLLPLAEGLDYVLQACVAVAHCHAIGVVHRDLKPENIMVLENPGQRGHVKVLDFGISKADWFETEHTPSLTGTTDVFGTPTHMSPEQVRSARNVDHRTDIWALGVVLYEVATGRPPFIAESLPAMAAMIVSDDPLPPSTLRPEIPADVERLILRCLAKRQDQRPQSVQAIARELAPFLAPASLPHVERIFAVAEAPAQGSAAASGAFVPVRSTSSAWGTTQGRGQRRRGLLRVGAALLVALSAAAVLSMLVFRFTTPSASVEALPAAQTTAEAVPAAPATAAPPEVKPAVPAPSASAVSSAEADAAAPPPRPRTRPSDGIPSPKTLDDRY